MEVETVPVEERLIDTDLDFKFTSREQKDFWRTQYIGMGDPFGYQFAEKWVRGGYRRWHKLQNTFHIRPEVNEWKQALEVKVRSEALLNIARQKDAFQAQRWLAEKGWDDKYDKRTKAAKKQAEQVEEAVASDMERLGLRRVK